MSWHLRRRQGHLCFHFKSNNVFFLAKDNCPNWRVVMQKESRLRRVEMELATDYVNMDPNMVSPMEHPQPMLQVPNLVGTIVLSASHAAMANQPLWSWAVHIDKVVVWCVHSARRPSANAIHAGSAMQTAMGSDCWHLWCGWQFAGKMLHCFFLLKMLQMVDVF